MPWRAARDGEQSADVDVALSVHPRHAVVESHSRRRIMSELVMLQRVAERAFPPASRAGRSKKWQKVAVFGCNLSIRTPV
jgi:hypothetical protein